MKSRSALVLLLSAVATCHGRSTRIVGGYMAEKGDIPSIVSVKLKDGGIFSSPHHICGGTIVNDNHVLTSASCVSGLQPSKIHVSGGDLDQNIYEDFQEDKTVNEVIIHPEYDANSMANNIAILRVSHNFVPVAGAIEPASLPEADLDLATGTPLWAAGWGAEQSGGEPRLALYIANMTYLASEECEESMLPGDSACISGEVGQGVCDLDNGGPVLDASGMQIGVICHAMECDAGPAVFVRTAPFYQWIHDQFDS